MSQVGELTMPSSHMYPLSAPLFSPMQNVRFLKTWLLFHWTSPIVFESKFRVGNLTIKNTKCLIIPSVLMHKK